MFAARSRDGTRTFHGPPLGTFATIPGPRAGVADARLSRQNLLALGIRPPPLLPLLAPTAP